VAAECGLCGVLLSNTLGASTINTGFDESKPTVRARVTVLVVLKVHGDCLWDLVDLVISQLMIVHSFPLICS
jgi:hypothetical protein